MLRRLDYQWQVLHVIAIGIGIGMVNLDTTIVNIALPRIVAVFGSAVEEAQLVITGYMLALAVMVPTSAYFNQTFGNKRMYPLTLALFTPGPAPCGLAWNVPSLILARVIQGPGGGPPGWIAVSTLPAADNSPTPQCWRTAQRHPTGGGRRLEASGGST